MTDTLLKVDNLSKHFSLKSFFSLFGNESDVVKAVDGISFGIKRGETYGVVGESGSGKSTTARLITRLIDPTSGTIEFDGQNISHLPLNDFHKIRPRIQMVFQDPYTSLNPRMRVSQALGNPLKLHEKYKKQVDLIVDGGTIFAEHSTIIDFSQGDATIIRHGKGPVDWIKNE